MNLDELIAALIAIRDNHGGLLQVTMDCASDAYCDVNHVDAHPEAGWVYLMEHAPEGK